jgi:hypothetical protein
VPYLKIQLVKVIKKISPPRPPVIGAFEKLKSYPL